MNTESPTHPESPDHAWVHERITAALAAGLSPAEQSLFDAHINNCPDCFDAFTEARDADRSLQGALSALSPSPQFEEKLLETLREKMMHKRFRPLVKRAGMGLAAAVALAATGVFAQYVVQKDTLTAPLSAELAANNREQGITLPMVWSEPTRYEAQDAFQVLAPPQQSRVTKNVRGLIVDDSRSMRPSGESGGESFKKEGDLSVINGKYVDQLKEKSTLQSSYDSVAKNITKATNDARLKPIDSEANIHREVVDFAVNGGAISGTGKISGTQNTLIALDSSGYKDNNSVATGAGSGFNDETQRLNPAKNYEMYGKTGTMSKAVTVASTPYYKPVDGQVKVYGVQDMLVANDATLKPPTFNLTDITQGRTTTGGQLSTNTAAPFDIVMVPTADVATGARDGLTSINGKLAMGDEKKAREDVNQPVDVPQKQIKGLVDEADKLVGQQQYREAADALRHALVIDPTNEGAKLNLKLIEDKITYRAYKTIVDTRSVETARNSPAASQTPPPASGQPDVEAAQRKIIRNGTVEFEVRSFDDASATISQVVTEEAGFVSSTSSDKLANGKIRGTVVVRVPPEHLDRTLLKLRSLGDLKTQQIAANDVTKQYTDIDSELRALRAMESRMVDLIKNGKGEVKDLVVAEQQLGEYRVRIEKLEGEIRYYNNLVGMATLTITAYEKDIQTPTAASEMEEVALSIETEDVEAKYKDARKILEDAKGRIVESELKKYDAEQYNAHMVVDVPPDKADLVTAQLKQIGRIGNYTRDRKQTTTGGTGVPTVQVEQKDTRFTITLYNLAIIAPRETATVTLAVRDVDATYHKVLDLVRKPGLAKTDDNGKPLPAADPAAAPVIAKPRGRIVASGMTGQLPQQMQAEIRADVMADEAAAVLQAIQDSGEIITNTSSESRDIANTTSAKRGIILRLVNVAAVPARETQALRVVAGDVPEAYKKLLAALQAAPVAGSIRIINSQLRETDTRTITAQLAFEARRDALPAVNKAFADAGIDFLSRSIIRASDGSTTLDSKVAFQIDELIAADSLPPRRNTVLVVEVNSVENPSDLLRSSLAAPNIKEIEFSLTKEPNAQGHLVIETPTSNAISVLTHIKSIGGLEKTNQVAMNKDVPDAPFARERIDLTLVSHEAIVENGKGFSATIRAALASSATALLISLYYVITGVLFLGPFALVAWIIYRLARRRKPVTT